MGQVMVITRNLQFILYMYLWWFGAEQLSWLLMHSFYEEKCNILLVNWGVNYIYNFSSFFQSVCTLGYCLLPLTLAVFISRVLLTSPLPSSVIFVIRLVIVIMALFWAVWGKIICKIMTYQIYFICRITRFPVRLSSSW